MTPEEIVFGNNMTTLTLHISRSISREWNKGDEIVVARLDYDANVTPWVLAAQDRGATVNWVDFDVEDSTLKLDDLKKLWSGNHGCWLSIMHPTRLVRSIPSKR